MSFKELLDKYKNGNASAEEIKLIEEELDKYESIEEYLSESYDLDFGNESSKETIKNESNLVKKKVNKKLRKLVLASVTVVFSILFIVYYVISPMIGSFYYNPAKKTVGNSHEDVYFDLKALIELNLPGYTIASTDSDSLGFGKYNINFQQVNLFNHQIKDANVKIQRNIRVGNLQDYHFIYNFVEFLDHNHPDSDTKFVEMKNDEVVNNIKELNSVSYVSTYIVLNNDLSLKGLDALVKKYNSKISFKWAGVHTENQGKPESYLAGFNPDYIDMQVDEDTADKTKYPYLQLGDYWKDVFNGNGIKPDVSMVDIYTKHFTSLLKYMIDRNKAVAALDNNQVKTEYYKNALNYVEKNGINIYGLLIYGEARDVLKFIDDQNIKTIEIKGVLPSKYID